MITLKFPQTNKKIQKNKMKIVFVFKLTIKFMRIFHDLSHRMDGCEIIFSSYYFQQECRKIQLKFNLWTKVAHPSHYKREIVYIRDNHSMEREEKSEKDIQILQNIAE